MHFEITTHRWQPYIYTQNAVQFIKQTHWSTTSLCVVWECPFSQSEVPMSSVHADRWNVSHSICTNGAVKPKRGNGQEMTHSPFCLSEASLDTHAGERIAVWEWDHSWTELVYGVHHFTPPKWWQCPDNSLQISIILVKSVDWCVNSYYFLASMLTLLSYLTKHPDRKYFL